MMSDAIACLYLFNQRIEYQDTDGVWRESRIRGRWRSLDTEGLAYQVFGSPDMLAQSSIRLRSRRAADELKKSSAT